MKHLELPDLKILKEYLEYDHETGNVKWIKKSSNNTIIGEIAGCKKGINNPYRMIRLNKKMHYLHRIAWKMFYGKDPSCLIDHINGIKDDNRIINLREANYSENIINRIRKNKTGYKGVFCTKTVGKTRYTVRICFKNKSYSFGCYDSKEEAAKRYDLEALKFYGEFARLNFPNH